MNQVKQPKSYQLTPTIQRTMLADSALANMRELYMNALKEAIESAARSELRANQLEAANTKVGETVSKNEYESLRAASEKFYGTVCRAVNGLELADDEERKTVTRHQMITALRIIQKEVEALRYEQQAMDTVEPEVGTARKG